MSLYTTTSQFESLDAYHVALRPLKRRHGRIAVRLSVGPRLLYGSQNRGVEKPCVLVSVINVDSGEILASREIWTTERRISTEVNRLGQLGAYVSVFPDASEVAATIEGLWDTGAVYYARRAEVMS